VVCTSTTGGGLGNLPILTDAQLTQPECIGPIVLPVLNPRKKLREAIDLVIVTD
jgi:hypothetical protein